MGSGVSLALWLLLTGLLALYVVKGGSFGTTYGPLTGIFALLLWANLSSVALFLGVAFAAQLEAVRAGAPTPATDGPADDGTPNDRDGARFAALLVAGVGQCRDDTAAVDGCPEQHGRGAPYRDRRKEATRRSRTKGWLATRDCRGRHRSRRRYGVHPPSGTDTLAGVPPKSSSLARNR